MTHLLITRRAALALAVALPLLLGALVRPALADEGMWTFHNFPNAKLKQQHGVELSDEWLAHLRQSVVRLSGCTATFVSAEGLILTNHHCAAACLAENSRQGQDRLADGFVSRSRDEEIKCSTQVADVLMGREDITAKLAAAVAGKDDKTAGEIRKRTLTQLEQACVQAAGTTDPRRCETVSLYQGGQYFLYKYKRYTDVRLAFAPEDSIAAFGGDPDNFQYPRWCLDMTLLRAYENGKPAKIEHFLPVNWDGPKAGELVFVAGHPGSTDRQLTVAQLEALRASLPASLLRSAELRGRYIQAAQAGGETGRIMSDPLMSLENGIKVRRKQLDALLDGTLMAQKSRDEAALRQLAKLGGANDPWVAIAKAEQRGLELQLPLTYIEGSAGFNSSLFRYARTLVRAAAERSKPNEERLREFTDSSLVPLQQRLFAPVPVYAEREKLTLSLGLMRLREMLGPDHPLAANLFKEISPEALADDLVNKTTLGDAAVRKQLWEGGTAAIEASTDPMIRIARLVDAQARTLRKQFEDEVESPIETASERIAKARFAAFGTAVYPDATFTLRLNWGTVQGWNENGSAVAPFSPLRRAYERATGAEPFRLPDSWLKARDRLNLDTPFNLSSNNDIVGGNSGSSMVNARGEVVGLVFDGNIHSISGSYWFDTARNRAVSVHPAIMKLALTQVYDTAALAAELGIKR